MSINLRPSTTVYANTKLDLTKTIRKYRTEIDQTKDKISLIATEEEIAENSSGEKTVVSTLKGLIDVQSKRIGLIVKNSGTGDSSELTLTDTAIEAMSKNISLKGKQITLTGDTVIDGTFKVGGWTISGDTLVSSNGSCTLNGSTGSINGATGSFKGTIEATKGTIGGWSINTSVLSATSGQDSLTLSKYGTINCQYINNSNTNTNRNVNISSGQIICSGLDTNIRKKVSILNGAIWCERENTSINNRVVITSDNVEVVNGSNELLFRANSVENEIYGYCKTVSFTASSNMNLNAKKYYFGNFDSGHTISVSGTIGLANNKYIFTKDKYGNDSALIGWSGGDNLWIGDYDQAILPANLFLAANNVYKLGTGGWASVSDRRMKKDITNIKEAEEFIMSLAPKSYRFIDGESQRLHFGFIAQDVEKTLSKTTGDAGIVVKYSTKDDVTVDLNDDSTYTVGLRYEEFIAPMVAVIQKQNKQIQALTETVTKLQNKLGVC